MLCIDPAHRYESSYIHESITAYLERTQPSVVRQLLKPRKVIVSGDFALKIEHMEVLEN